MESNQSTTTSLSSGYQIILRKIGEDALLRPFLSNLFDPQHYIKNIIQQSKSEGCYDACQCH